MRPYLPGDISGFEVRVAAMKIFNSYSRRHLMKIGKILLPFDGSVHSINAANYALELAKFSRAHVTVAHCYVWRGDVSEVSESVAENLRSIAREKAQGILQQAEEIFVRQGVEYELEAIIGSAGTVLPKRAESREYDLIIMGSHGHSDIAGLFLGSVTHKVLNTIYCPVLIVP